ncbi:hypothetical protein TWF730_000175 [Orbilia blumenaviensis]|uniref:Uncharacterized protein n=1 Tax=Orbilia blumenaviensis TaxID=1796055 RepID=A0AAV9VKR3_9PEZI
MLPSASTLPIFGLFFLIPNATAEDTEPAPQVKNLCIDQLWNPGECVIQIDWRRLDAETKTERGDRTRRIYEKIRSIVFDANGTVITPSPAEFEDCTGTEDRQCVVQSLLGEPIKLSPQINGNPGGYLQYYFGSQAWHTDPVPNDGGRPYVGKDVEGLRPYCEDQEWQEWEKNPEGYVAPYSGTSPKYYQVLSKQITCWFECKDIHVRWGERGVSYCPESEPQKLKVMAEMVETTMTTTDCGGSLHTQCGVTGNETVQIYTQTETIISTIAGTEINPRPLITIKVPIPAPVSAPPDQTPLCRRRTTVTKTVTKTETVTAGNNCKPSLTTIQIPVYLPVPESKFRISTASEVYTRTVEKTVTKTETTTQVYLFTKT